MRLSFFAALSFSLLTTAAMAPAVSAQPDYRASVPGWDSRGWVLLGEKQVDRRVDQDTIVVGRQAGNFNNLTMAVLDSDLELLSINILFDDGSTASPAMNYFFREGTRTRAFDLPGNNRFIREIRLKYRNTPGGGKARVQIYGRQGNTGAQPSQPPPPPASSWNSTGWIRLGGAGIKARNPNLTIKAGRRVGVFSELTVHVPTQDLFINKVFVTYDNGTTFGAKVNHAFAGNDRTVVVALPRNTRHIRNIRFTHNAPVGLNPTIEVWGRGTIAAPPPAPPVVTPTPLPPSQPAFDPTGWRLLGETRVEGRRDRDVIRMEPGKMAMRRIVIVVSDSDLDMQSILVRFGKGQVFTPNVKHLFREGSRSRVIDLPGDVNRVFEIELKYGNTWGGGRARVQVYGQ